MAEPRRTGGGATATRTAKQRARYQRPTTTVKTDRSGKNDINSGLTAAQRRAVTEWEDKNRNYKTEHTIVVDRNGTVNPRGPLQVGSGTGNRARVNPFKLVPDGVVTHNHPSNGVGIAGRVGVPFSGADVKLAMKYNLNEIRAVTPNYTYSVRRPTGGWSGSPESLEREYMAITRREARNMRDDTLRVLNASGGVSRQDADVYNNRISTLASHRAMEELAKRYGFSYTRKRTR